MQVKVKKYTKKKNGLYHILFENGKVLDLYEEVILKYNLLIRPLDVTMMYEIEKYNQEWEVYYVALKYIKYKARTVDEVRVHLKKKEYPIDIINKILTKLESQGYLNDLSYSKSFLNMKILTTTRVREDLRKRGVSSEIIEEVIEEYTDDIQREKIKKVISKKINSNHNKSARVLKVKIVSELLNDGFSRELVLEEIAKNPIKDSPDLVKREYQKIYNKLSRKYEGEELKYKIRQKMYQKGLNYEEFY